MMSSFQADMINQINRVLEDDAKKKRADEETKRLAKIQQNKIDEEKRVNDARIKQESIDKAAEDQRKLDAQAKENTRIGNLLKAAVGACANGDIKTVAAVFKESSAVQKVFLDSYPLHVAAQNGQNAIISLLMNNGARMNLKDARGKLAVELAVDAKHEATVELLEKEEEEQKKFNKQIDGYMQAGVLPPRVEQYLLDKMKKEHIASLNLVAENSLNDVGEEVKNILPTTLKNIDQLIYEINATTNSEILTAKIKNFLNDKDNCLLTHAYSASKVFVEELDARKTDDAFLKSLTADTAKKDWLKTVLNALAKSVIYLLHFKMRTKVSAGSESCP